jgi:hypothetical protein
MSMITEGTVNSGPSYVQLLGAALQRLFQQAAVPIRPELLSGYTNLGQVFAQWHQCLGAAQQRLASQVPLASVSCAKAMEQALAQVPLLQEVGVYLCPGQWQQARLALQQVDDALARGDTQRAESQAQLAQRHLEELIFQSHERLAVAQLAVVHDTIAATLQEMGYQVGHQLAEQRSAIYATRGAESIAMVLESDGDFQMDMAGFSGLDCEQAQQALVQRLEAKGIQLQPRRKTPHGDRGGGQLLKKALQAARQQHLSVTQALLRTTARPSHPHDLRRRRMIVWGQQQIRQ